MIYYNSKEDISGILRQKIDYHMPCISASKPIEELIRKNLFILIPFQQVQLNSRMNQISKRSDKAKHRIATEIFSFHQQMKKNLEMLYADAIIEENEYYALIEVFSDVEGYLVDKDEDVRQEVDDMGDNDYVSRSERAKLEGRLEGELKKLISIICKKKIKGLSVEETAEILEEDFVVVNKIYEISDRYAPEYDAEKICKEYLSL